MAKANSVLEAVARAILVAHNELYTDEKSVDMYFAQQEHSGDCTKQAWTCNKCYVDMYRKQARAALTVVLDHMGEPGVRNELVAAVCKASEMPGIRMIADGFWQAMLSQFRKEALDG